MQQISYELTNNFTLQLADNYQYILYTNNNDLDLDLTLLSQVNEHHEIIIIDCGTNNQLRIIHDLNQDSSVKYKVISFNKGNAQHQLKINLNGVNSSCDLQAIAYTYDNKYQLNVSIYNNKPHSHANIWMHGVNHHGSLIFNPVGKITKLCDDSTNHQESRILLLNECQNSQVDPVLLIDYYNVLEASHAASISRISDELIYYLQSRGIDKNSANLLLTQAFLLPLINQLDKNLQTKMLDLMQSQLTFK